MLLSPAGNHGQDGVLLLCAEEGSDMCVLQPERSGSDTARLQPNGQEGTKNGDGRFCLPVERHLCKAFLMTAELVMYWIGALCSSTERAKARLWKHQYIDYGYEIPDNVMALLLGLTFCIISPLIAPIALLYFVVNSIIGKYTLIYVYAERFQSGGKVSHYGPVMLVLHGVSLMCLCDEVSVVVDISLIFHAQSC